MFFISISKNAAILLLFAVISSGLSALTYWLTKDKIQSEKELALQRMLVEIVDEKYFNNDVYRDCVLVKSDANIAKNNSAKLYRMRKNGDNTAVIIETTTAEGYSGDITIAVGIFTTGKISHVRVIDHKETPGLGDKVEARKSDWLTQFTNKSLDTDNQDKWQVKKDGGQFDAITGATITPRAVVGAVRDSLLYWEENKNQLFTWPATCHDAT